MSDLVFTTRGTAEVIAEQEKIAQSLGKQKTLAKELSAQYAANEGDLKRLGRVAQQIYLDNETATEKYNRKLAEAKSALQGNVNQVELLERAEKSLAIQFSTSATAAEKTSVMRKELMGQATAEEKKLNAAIVDTADATARAGGKLKQAFGADALAGLKSLAAGYLSFQQVVQVGRAELEAIRAEEEHRTRAQLEAAPARDVLKRNIIGLGIKPAEAFIARGEKLADKLSLPQRVIDVALAEAFSASEGDVEKTFSRTEVAARFLKTKQTGIAEFTGSLGDISKATHSQDSLRNLGFLIRVGAASRVAEADKQAKTIPSALAGGASFGATAEESGALFDAISGYAADPEGRRTATGVIRLTEQLKKFIDKEVIKGPFADKPGMKDADTFAKRLALLRSDPALAKAFAAKASFQAKVKGPITDFILNAPGRDPNQPSVSQQYEKFKTSFGTVDDQRKTANEMLAYLDQGRVSKTAAVERTIGAKVESYQLTQDAQLTPESRDKIIERGRELTGTLALVNRFGTWLRTGVAMSPQEAVSELQSALATNQMYGGRGVDPALITNTEQMIIELKAMNSKLDDVGGLGVNAE